MRACVVKAPTINSQSRTSISIRWVCPPIEDLGLSGACKWTTAPAERTTRTNNHDMIVRCHLALVSDSSFRLGQADSINSTRTEAPTTSSFPPPSDRRHEICAWRFSVRPVVVVKPLVASATCARAGPLVNSSSPSRCASHSPFLLHSISDPSSLAHETRPG